VKKRILLADDHKIVAEGLRSLLEPEFEFTGTVERCLKNEIKLWNLLKRPASCATVTH